MTDEVATSAEASYEWSREWFGDETAPPTTTVYLAGWREDAAPPVEIDPVGTHEGQVDIAPAAGASLGVRAEQDEQLRVRFLEPVANAALQLARVARHWRTAMTLTRHRSPATEPG